MRYTCRLLVIGVMLAFSALPVSAAIWLATGFDGIPLYVAPGWRVTAASTEIAGVSATAAGTRVVQFDLSGLASYDALHILGNVRFTFELEAHERVGQIEIVVTGIENDPAVGADGGSWPSEARLAFHSAEGEIFLDIPLYSSPAYDHNGTSDAPDLPTLFTGTDLWHPGFQGPGQIILQLYETLDDAPGIADGIYRGGSYVRITIVPEPLSLCLLAAGLAWPWRRRMRDN